MKGKAFLEEEWRVKIVVRKLKRGFVHVYIGEGKGKTTAALGLSLRAVGYGFRVFIIQFMKSFDKEDYGEIIAIRNSLRRNCTIIQFGAGFVGKNPNKADFISAKMGMRYAKEAVESERYDIIVLDEINIAVHYGLIEEEEVLKLVKSKPKSVELVLTGRYATPKIIEVADYVTEMKKIKHPFPKVNARKGIEY